jgi:magnesium and cobalt transporter
MNSNNDTRNNETEERSWLDRLTQMVTGTPYTRADLEGVVAISRGQRSYR